MNNFEKLIEYIINEDEAKAKALFHKIVVEKSRNIYEGLMDDEQGPVQDGQGAESFGDEIEQDQAGIEGDEQGIDDEFGGDAAGDEFGGDAAGDEFGGEEAPIEDRVMDLEDAIDELKAEFDALMGDDAGGDEFGGDEFGGDEFGGDDLGGDDGASEVDADEEGTEELGDKVDTGEEKKFGEASIYGEGRKSPSDLMREYVEKVTAVKPVEGDPVGAGGTKSPINSKSTQISGKNDMGGTTANIAQGKFASDRDSNTGPKKPSNAYTKGEKKMGQEKYENSPAANTKGYKDKQSAKTKEGADTSGSQPVAKKSFNPGGTSGYKG